MNKSILGKLDVVSVFIAWALYFISFAALFYSVAFAESDSSATILIYLFGAALIASITHLILSYYNRCPHCNRCLTVQGFQTPHPASNGSWNRVVWHWFSRSIVCIHSGQSVDTSRL